MQHTIHVGDTLQGLAQEHYGNANMWPKIYHANEQRLKNPDNMPPGERITIPD
jgi:nucleoid-associated protein YgaU